MAPTQHVGTLACWHDLEKGGLVEGINPSIVKAGEWGMALTEWWEERRGFIGYDVIRWRDPAWIGRKKNYTGEGFGGQRLSRAGNQRMVAEVIEGADDEGWYTLLVFYDNLKPVLVNGKKKKIRRHHKTLMQGGAERRPWEDERERARLVAEEWSDELHASFMGMALDEEES